MQKSQTRLLFYDIMINKRCTKIWMDIYNKATNSNWYVPFTSDLPRHSLTNIPFSLARRICTIVENENVKEKCIKELKKRLLKQKYPASLIEASIKKAKEIPLEVLRQRTTIENEKIIFVTTPHNPNNSNIFSITKQSLDNF